MVQVEELQEELLYSQRRIEELEALNSSLKQSIEEKFLEKKEQAVDIQESLEEAQEENIQQQKRVQILQKQIEELLSQKREQEKKNAHLQERIDELLKMMQESEKHIEKAHKNSTLNDIKIEPKIYLKGMFDSFIKEKSALKILIEGGVYYYSLESYQCAHLPVSGSRVLIFKSEDGENIVYGFNVSKLIDSAPKIKATVKFVSVVQNRLKLHMENYGFINFTPAKELWENMEFRLGETLMLSKIDIDGRVYFTIAKKTLLGTNRNEILKLLIKDDI